MENIVITATSRTPAVSFDFASGVLRISGESYPEDVSRFYNPLYEALDRYLGQLSEGSCRFDFALVYFNSSSAKAIMMLMERLDAAAEAGLDVDVHWFYDPEDETMHELGEDFGEDLEHARFCLEKIGP